MMNDNNSNGSRPSQVEPDDSATPNDSKEPIRPADSAVRETAETPSITGAARLATRAGMKNTDGMSKSKLMLLGAALAVAVLFFVFTAVVGKPMKKAMVGNQTTQQTKQNAMAQPKGSVTPVMDTDRVPVQENTSGQLGPNDIRRTRSSNDNASVGTNAQPAKTSRAPKPAAASLGSVPSFADTQQKWEEPRPYDSPSASQDSQAHQQQNALKEPSLIFVKTQVEGPARTGADTNPEDDAPRLDLTPGTRILAKLQTQISSAVPTPVVAVVEYTYAIGDKIVVPAGAQIYGQLVQADRSGLVNVKFNEIEFLDATKETIGAIGLGLDLGPIKGDVYGKNTGKNFLVRAGSGLGSVLAEIAGNNSSAAFSEDDMLRERVAENIGTAGDSEVMNLNANSRVVVSVPAGREIYIVFTKTEESSPQFHKVATATP